MDTTGTTAWREGWDMPLEKTIAEVLMPEARGQVILDAGRGEFPEE